MKPSIVKAGLCSAVTAAVTVTLTGLVPATALAGPAFPQMATKLAGKTVFLDPGHQGSGHSQDVAKQVSDGRGGMKDCQTTGMTTVHGVPEHTINWNVAQLVQTALESLGAKVVLSRPDDQGWGGCIDERARAANQSGADVAVSIHADSAPADQRGFHLIVPELPIPDATIDKVQSGAGRAASIAVRDAYLQAGFLPAKYASQDGLQPRSDIAGPALTAVPDVFIEMGNGANAEDAALLEGQEGQLRHAIAITTGLASYLLGDQSANAGAAAGQPAAGPQPVPAPLEPQSGSAAEPQPAPKPVHEPQDGLVPQPHPASTEPPAGMAPQPQAVPAPETTFAQQAGLTPQPGTAPQTGFAPQAQAAPPLQTAPGTLPWPGTPETQTSPGTSPWPATPGTQTSPGTSPWPATPGAQTSPGTSPWPATPGTQASPGTKTSPESQTEMMAIRSIVDMALTMLVPMAKALGMDNNMVTMEMINLAYTLAAKFIAPAK
ncbi:N-acetylmuramoyl-L-alanine amidase [Nocardia altamirensis]|uniref:N-acetylmuramoyl-L-alanine amidase n=1 Tax=Nocardia altamirensis TaxID=472158 RepID=UPI0008400536